MSVLHINGLELELLTSDPGTPNEGHIWYNTTLNKVRGNIGGVVQDIIDQGEFDAHSTSTSNPHTVTLEQARTAGATLAGIVNFGGFALQNIGGALATDAASRGYVDDTVASVVQGIDWQDSVLDKDLTAPPGGETTGDRYIVGGSATGAWVGQDDSIAEYNGAGWDFTVPNEGFTTRAEDENVLYVYDGAAWGVFAAVTDHGGLTGLGDDDHTQYLLIDGTRAMTGTLAMGANNITTTGTVDGVTVSAHAARHERGGADEIDGDHLDIDYTPTNYTPSIVPAEAANVDDLAAHLAGIDTALASGGVEDDKAGNVASGSFAGTPRKVTVTFATPFGSAAYGVVLSPVTTGDVTFAPAVESQLAGSFVINMGANTITGLTQCNWLAIPDRDP